MPREMPRETPREEERGIEKNRENSKEDEHIFLVTVSRYLASFREEHILPVSVRGYCSHD